ncbi:MAG: N-6 DNA methylase [Spirochaetota bacterium]
MAFAAFQFDPQKMKFYASCADGLDTFLREELSQYRLKIISSGRAGCSFRGSKEQLANFTLKTRFSSRVSVILKEFYVTGPEELYQTAKQFPWEKLLPSSKSFSIDANTSDQLANSRFAMYRLKDAIKDRLREKKKDIPEITKNNAAYCILLRSTKGKVSLQLSLSSIPLHKRGYRVKNTGSPLRETLAQAVLTYSGWQHSENILDPFCGSGTLLIESALLLQQNGEINRQQMMNSSVYEKVFGSLTARDIRKKIWPKLIGSDSDANAVEIANENARTAGVADHISFVVKDAKQISEFAKELGQGHIITNPPYGIRIGDEEELKPLYQNLGKIFKDHFSGFAITLICGNRALPAHLKLKEEKSLKLPIAGLKGKISHYRIL